MKEIHIKADIKIKKMLTRIKNVEISITRAQVQIGCQLTRLYDIGLATITAMASLIFLLSTINLEQPARDHALNMSSVLVFNLHDLLPTTMFFFLGVMLMVLAFRLNCLKNGKHKDKIAIISLLLTGISFIVISRFPSQVPTTSLIVKGLSIRQNSSTNSGLFGLVCFLIISALIAITSKHDTPEDKFYTSVFERTDRKAVSKVKDTSRIVLAHLYLIFWKSLWTKVTEICLLSDRSSSSIFQRTQNIAHVRPILAWEIN